jgi:hypothetical protein
LPEDHRKASCSFFPRPRHGPGRHSDRPWGTTKHLATTWSTATRRCRFTRRLTRPIAVIGDLPAISVIVSPLAVEESEDQQLGLSRPTRPPSRVARRVLALLELDGARSAPRCSSGRTRGICSWLVPEFSSWREGLIGGQQWRHRLVGAQSLRLQRRTTLELYDYGAGQARLIGEFGCLLTPVFSTSSGCRAAASTSPGRMPGGWPFTG